MASSLMMPPAASSKADLLNLIDATADHHDFLSNTPHLHMAFIFSTIINNLKEKLTLTERLHRLHAEIARAAEIENPEMLLLSGSSVEGLYIPVYLKQYMDGTRIQVSPDFDAMLVNQRFLVHNDDYSGDYLKFDSSGCHAGYTKIKVVQDLPDKTLSVRCIGLHHYLTKNVYSQVNDNIINALTIFGGDKEGELKELGVDTENQCLTQGPALTGEGSFFMWEKTMNIQLEVDTVPSLKTEWPAIAKAWIHRKRRGSWPSEALIKKIVSEGCHVVPVSHSCSRHPCVEWRLSFSKAEISLAHSLTGFQRSCYRIFKILCHVGIIPKKVIATYFLKTTFFWLCEEMPDAFWEPSNISFIIIALIERLLAFVVKHNLPNFFIAENNMIDHILPEKVEKALRSITSIRCDPLKSLMQFASYCIFTEGGLPWNTTFRHVIEDIPKYMKYKWLLLTVTSFATSLKRCGVSQITCRSYQEALGNYATLADVVEVTTQCEISKRLSFASDHSLNLPIGIPSITLFTNLNNLIEFHDYLISMDVGHEEEAVLESMMGYIYLILSQLPTPTFDDEYYTSVLESLAKVCEVDYNMRYLSHTEEHLEKACEFLQRSLGLVGRSNDAKSAKQTQYVENRVNHVSTEKDPCVVTPVGNKVVWNKEVFAEDNGNVEDSVREVKTDERNNVSSVTKIDQTPNDDDSDDVDSDDDHDLNVVAIEKQRTITSNSSGKAFCETQKGEKNSSEWNNPLCRKKQLLCPLQVYCRLAQVHILQGRANKASEYLHQVMSHPRKTMEEVKIRWFESHLYEVDPLVISIHKGCTGQSLIKKDRLDGPLYSGQCRADSGDTFESKQHRLSSMVEHVTNPTDSACKSEDAMVQSTDLTSVDQSTPNLEKSFLDDHHLQNTQEQSEAAHQRMSSFSKLLQSEVLITLPCDLFAQYLLVLVDLHQRSEKSCTAALGQLGHWFESSQDGLEIIHERKERNKMIALSLYNDCHLIMEKLNAQSITSCI